MTFPRTLILTWHAPDMPYKILLRTVRLLPPELVYYSSLRPCSVDREYAFAHKAFEPRQLHWRFQSSLLNLIYTSECQGKALAGRIAEWAVPFRPEVIWVVAQLGALNVGYHLHRMLKIPIHATVQDAHENARSTLPLPYYPIYMRSVDRLLRNARTVDAISMELLGHLEKRYSNITASENMVFHPTISRKIVVDLLWEKRLDTDAHVRRIGFCGSMRISREQWLAFLNLLGQLPFKFEIIAFADKDHFHHVELPSNVEMKPQPYAATEADVVRGFRDTGVHACHLGLWKEENRALFGGTSLSAKLITYAASGLPIIVDGPSKSVAWRLVKKHGAGVLYESDESSALDGLGKLFGDAEVWRRMAEGSARMCRTEYDLEDSVERFKDILCKCAGGGCDNADQ